MVLPDSHGVPRVPRYSGAVCAAFDFRYGGFTLYAQASQLVPLSNHGSRMTVLQPRMLESTRFGLVPFRSPLLWESLLISLPSGTEMFHFPELAPLSLCIQQKGDRALPRTGFPIRKSPDQSLFDGSPKHIAVFHVLHRLLAPRHPPDALTYLQLTPLRVLFLTLFNCQ